MSIALVAFDLDGTLLGRDLRISPRVREAIDRMHQRGVRGCIATGRMYRATLPFVRELGFTAPTICYQGAWIVDSVLDRRLFDCPIAAPLVAEIIDALDGSDAHLQLYESDIYLCERANRFSDLYARLSGVEPLIRPLREYFMGRSATKAVVVADPKDARALEVKLQSIFGERLYITRSYPEFVEMLDPRVDKGDALRKVAEGLDIPLDRVMAIGDAWNDLPLLEAAGFGVAMGNAPQEL
ncbi:MAG TPA: Cof-type HAD-IIB family hydrolase, partial [Candidatus Dormibacteraeota bacterium]|nr:Cof-type HAD-IIB family hydrolase [Candidatus Dormibacteraeota bacterium]